MLTKKKKTYDNTNSLQQRVFRINGLFITKMIYECRPLTNLNEKFESLSLKKKENKKSNAYKTKEGNEN